MSNSEIKRIKNENIDRLKWDRCVAASPIPLIYAQSEYLDLISPNWEALIAGDYSYIMPLIIKRKFGIAFVLQPIFAQQHGIFPEANTEIQNQFFAYLQKHFSYISINLNTFHSEPFPEKFEYSRRNNFILDLSAEYAEIETHYSKHARRQIRKAEDLKVNVIQGIQPEEYIRLKNQATQNKLSKSSMKTLQRIIEFGVKRTSTIYAAYTPENTLCSAAFFLFAGERVVYLNAASNEEGKNNSSMYRIVDQFIKEHSGEKLTLDFEGSMIPGIARFYSGFGAIPEHYFGLKMNRLPIPLRWLIK